MHIYFISLSQVFKRRKEPNDIRTSEGLSCWTPEVIHGQSVRLLFCCLGGWSDRLS